MSDRVRALRFVARCLRPDYRTEITQGLRSEIVTGRVAWEVVVNLADEHLVTPSLWMALRRRGLTDCLADDVAEYLSELHRLNARRNRHLARQVQEAARELNRVGVEPVLLKGAAHLFLHTFADPAARVMTDLDILVPQGQFDASLRVLHALGYRTTERHEERFARHHHHAPLFRSGDYAAIELHRHPVARRIAHVLPASFALENAQSLSLAEGTRVGVLSPTHRVVHNLLHCEIADGNYSAGVIDLRSLHETAATQNVCGKEVEWPVVRELMDRNGYGSVLRAYLHQLHRLFGVELPQGVQPTLRAVMHDMRCRAQLRWIRLGNSVERAVELASWFSAESIARRYDCSHQPVSLALGRFRYAGAMFLQLLRRAG